MIAADKHTQASRMNKRQSIIRASHSDPLITWIEEDPMNARMFLEWDAEIPRWVNLIYRIRLFFGV
jgi:hypothetical protein